MSFWFNKRETGAPYDEADRLFNEAVTLSRESGRALEAERSLVAAIAAYRTLVNRTKGYEAERRLAKALWRKWRAGAQGWEAVRPSAPRCTTSHNTGSSIYRSPRRVIGQSSTQ
jgi:hypothetical protein